MSTPRRKSWATPVVFIILALLAMPGFIVPNDSPMAELLFPGFIALYLCLLLPRRRENLARLGVHKFGKLRAYAPILLLLLATAASYAVPALLGLGKANPLGKLDHIIAFIPLAIYEEVGWRGYLQSQLTERVGVRKAVLAVGVLWAVWHSGLLVSGQLLGPGATMGVGAALFAVSAVLISIVLGFTRFKTGSVWPAVVGHAGINYVQEFGDGLFAHPSQAFNYTSGAVSLVLLAALAWYCWKKLPAGVTAQAKRSA
ncbi:MAG TPA: CPBP family intramembrane glutamic endopeptidase [Candidatus Saccharimonadales bacterium]|nr:CPBP family intramembrane glutamic endopeptidase [Candidatus Saccharimonadales bacterium]